MHIFSQKKKKTKKQKKQTYNYPPLLSMGRPTANKVIFKSGPINNHMTFPDELTLNSSPITGYPILWSVQSYTLQKYAKFTDADDDDRRKVMTKAHMTLWVR